MLLAVPESAPNPMHGAAGRTFGAGAGGGFCHLGHAPTMTAVAAGRLLVSVKRNSSGAGPRTSPMKFIIS